MRSTSAVAEPQVRVPVPAERALLATKLNLHVALVHEELETLFGVVHVPPVHEKKSLVPAVRRVEPWLIHPCSCSAVTVGVPKVKSAVAVPSRPPMINGLVTDPVMVTAD